MTFPLAQRRLPPEIPRHGDIAINRAPQRVLSSNQNFARGFSRRWHVSRRRRLESSQALHQYRFNSVSGIDLLQQARKTTCDFGAMTLRLQ
jgi:hypothetical protein